MNTKKLPVCNNHAVCFAKVEGRCIALVTADWPDGCPFWKLTADGPNEYDKQKAESKEEVAI